ncbi:hypothetical protein AVEN_158963-1 [Araneus ventricosus]|uniref:Uncharacterized protein n=1 Tax=Araneus ventricosus TaxID=182803 RepID=A0A4Y2B9X6_ARAVE|nr:hypothetical protein AVEN_158963-1 [Araneus ventricosus]
MPKAGNCLPLLGSVMGGAVGTRIVYLLCLGKKKFPSSGHQIQQNVTYHKHFDKSFVVKRVSSSNDTFRSVSLFLVEKVISADLRAVSSVRKLRSGDLLIEVLSQKQDHQIMELKNLVSIPSS